MYIQLDASQLEFRVVIELCRDPVGMREIAEQQDIHSLNQIAFGLPDRLTAKRYLFRTIFNHGKGYAFTADPEFMHVSTSVKYWDDVGQKFYKKYAKLEEMYQKNMKLISQGVDIVGPLGAFWPLRLERDWKNELIIPETKCVNYPTQGTAAQVMALARVSFFNRLKKQPWRDEALMVSSVHDSIVVDAKEEHIPALAAMAHSVFADLPLNIKRMFKYDWVVPLACECKTGNTLKGMQKFT